MTGVGEVPANSVDQPNSQILDSFDMSCSYLSLAKECILKRPSWITSISAALAFTLSVLYAHAQQQPSPLELQKAIPVPSSGKFDHFAVDLKAKRLFIAATGSRSVDIVDLDSGHQIQSLTNFGKPHGLAWIGETGRLYASDGDQADLKVFEDTSLKSYRSVKLSPDADDMVFDPKTKLLYVGHGGSASNPGQIAVIDTSNQSIVANLPASAHPEGLEIDNANDRIFANIADAGAVVVIDGATHTQTAVWQLTRAKDNVPLAYDSDDELLFVACRKPARLLILDGKNGKELADLPSDNGADDLFYDAELHRIYLIAGSGSVNIYNINSSKTVHAVSTIPTSPGAKTGLFIPSLHSLYIGAPINGAKPAEILVYKTNE